MNIISRSQWRARHARGFRAAALPAREIYLHHSVTSPGPGTPAGDAAAVRTLENIGQQRFGGGISYTFAVAPSGRVYDGHGVDRQGAHTGGRNSIARAICLIGNYETTRPPEAMLNAVADLVAHGHRAGWWPDRLTGGHRDAPGASTACPGKQAHALIPDINRRVAARLRGPQPTPPSTPGDDPVIFDKTFLVPGRNDFRLTVPVGSASAPWGLETAVLSIVGNGPVTGTVYVQNDERGLVNWPINVTNRGGICARFFKSLPDGTTQLGIVLDAPNGGTVTIEGKEK